MQLTSHLGSDSLRYSTPGVYFEEVAPTKGLEFGTGVPAFLGFSQPTKLTDTLKFGKHFYPYTLTGEAQFREVIGDAAAGFLDHAVRGFFNNGGTKCVVIGFPLKESGTRPVGPTERDTLKSLEVLESREDVDLVCFPDLAWAGEQMIPLQQQVLEWCGKTRGRFAILDSGPCNLAEAGRSGRVQARDLERMLTHWHQLPPGEGALYFPWIQVKEGSGARSFIPPCGH